MSYASRRVLARPSFLPSFESDNGLPVFETVSDALAAYEGDDAFAVLYPHKIAEAARSFLKGFPGKILYAVKANPHPAVLQTLWLAGVRAFDVASTREIELVQYHFPDAELYLMHPIKSRATIRNAYEAGVRHFAFDCAEELAKIVEETGAADDLTLHLRLALPTSDAAMPLSGKFGAGFETAPALLAAARAHAVALGVTFHVGSQCLDVDSYDRALGFARSVVDASGVAIDSIDCGGGYPVAYPGMAPRPWADYFAAIRASLKAHGFGGLTVLGEPGRALCAAGGSTVARVELRKGSQLYLNDGTYGSLFDAGVCHWKFPVKRLRKGDRAAPAADAETEGFSLFGPTCDSLDKMDGPFHLPGDIAEGDWIEFGHLGAYGQTLATEFNGFGIYDTVAVMSRGF